MSRAVPFRQFVLKVHSRCDLACDHCYVYEHADQSWRGRPRELDPATAAQAGRRIAQHAREHGLAQVGVVLHGGEPLLLGPGRMRETLRALCREAAPSTRPRPARTHQRRGVGRGVPRPVRRVRREGGRLAGRRAGRERPAPALSRRPQQLRPGRGRLSGGCAGPDTAASTAACCARSISPTTPWRSTADCSRRNCRGSTCCFRTRPGSTSRPGSRRRATRTGRRRGPGSTRAGSALYSTSGMRTAARCRSAPSSPYSPLTRAGRWAPRRWGSTPVDLLVIETDGALEQVDSLKTAYDGAAATGLDVWRHSLDEAAAVPGIAVRQHGIDGIGPVCRDCALVRICGGGLYPHRYRPGYGFANPSVYCADLKQLITHVVDVEAQRGRGRTTVVPIEPAGPRKASDAGLDDGRMDLTEAEFAGLASGFGSTSAARVLARNEAEIGRNLLALLAHEGPQGDRRFADSWDLLVAVAAQSPRDRRAPVRPSLSTGLGGQAASRSAGGARRRRGPAPSRGHRRRRRDARRARRCGYRIFPPRAPSARCRRRGRQRPEYL